MSKPVGRVEAIAGGRPARGYRRATALLNRARRASGDVPVNRKRVLRLVRQASPTLRPHTGRRPTRAHEGTVVAPSSGRRRACGGFEIPCWNGEAARAAFAADTHDRGVAARAATVGAGDSGGETVRDTMLECVERRSDAARTPEPARWLADNGSAYTAGETVDFAAAPNLAPCFAPIRSPESNGACEAFAKTLKRGRVRVNPGPDAISVLQQLPAWSGGHNAVHPPRHSGLRTPAPREFIAQQPATPAACPV